MVAKGIDFPALLWIDILIRKLVSKSMSMHDYISMHEVFYSCTQNQPFYQGYQHGEGLAPVYQGKEGQDRI